MAVRLSEGEGARRLSMPCSKLPPTRTEVSGEATVGRETGAEIGARNGWAVMSKRFLRCVEIWIEENIPPGANPDLES